MIRKILIAVLLVMLVIGGVLPALAADAAPVAQNDSLEALAGENNGFPAGTLFADNGSGEDDLGTPEATIESYGGGSMGGDVTSNPAGTQGSLAGGTIKVNANGSLVLNNPTETGLFTFIYRLRNTAGSNDAVVIFDIKEAPQAERDRYVFLYDGDQSFSSADGLFADNGHGADNLGAPAAALVSFGGRSLDGGVTTNPAGSSVPLADGLLIVNANGSWSLSDAPFTPGVYSFRYRLTNLIGSSDATVTLVIQAKPVAEDDALDGTLDLVNTFPAGTLFADNGSGADDEGFPEAEMASFGGGSLGGSVTDNAPGTTVAFAGGTLKVNQNGSLVIDNPTTGGTFTFLYRLSNDAGSSDATVTVHLTKPPVAKDDDYTFINTADQSFDTATGLFGPNGHGLDILGVPQAPLVSFGGGFLGGTPTDNAAGSSVPLAGGVLIVKNDGSWTLTGQPFKNGTFTFDYRLQNVAGASLGTVTLTIQALPTARDDTLYPSFGAPYVGSLLNNNGFGPDNLGTPQGSLTSFGGGSLGGDVTSNAAGATVPFAGGTMKVESDGTISISSTSTAGIYTFSYRLTNSLGTSDAQVTLLVTVLPDAEDDLYAFDYAADKYAGATVGLFADNGSGTDDLGNPAATLATFGGKSLGGSVSDHAAGTSALLAGGTLKVNSNGSWSLTGAPLIPGEYMFDYRIVNPGGLSDATVTFRVGANPDARDDDLQAQLYVKTQFSGGHLFGDNGHGEDEAGFPASDLVSFGGGDAGGTVSDNAPGTTVDFAGGKLTVNADGSLMIDSPADAGTFTFEYRLESTIGTSDALVTVVIAEEAVMYRSLSPVIYR